MDEKIKKLYDFECIVVENDREKIMEQYYKMRSQGLIEGYTPLIIIKEALQLYNNLEYEDKELEEYGGFTKWCLGEYPKIDAKEFFHVKFCEYKEDDMLDSGEDDNEEETSEGNNSLFLGYDTDIVIIGKIPTIKPYEVFAYIPMGGFNDCPSNDIHISVAKYWYEKYGVIPICIGSDTIQYKLEKPYTGTIDFKQLAMEQYCYCGDIVWQGVESVRNLEILLTKSDTWYFWWD